MMISLYKAKILKMWSGTGLMIVQLLFLQAMNSIRILDDVYDTTVDDAIVKHYTCFTQEGLL